MLTTYTLHTSQLDDLDLAVEDIITQVQQKELRQNTVGLLVCHLDYADDGIVKALQQALPFPLLGFITFYQKTPSGSGLFELSITVFTSDDVRFSISGGTFQEGQPPQETIALAYQHARLSHGQDPSFIFSCMTMDAPISGDRFLQHLDQCSGGVPCFGCLSAGDDDAGTNLYVFQGKNQYARGFAMLHMVGDVQPRFYYRNYRPEKIMEMTATATQGEGNRVDQLNGQNAYAFMEKNGIVLTAEEKARISTIPFMYKVKGSNHLVGRTLGRISPEGEAHFLGGIPPGAEIRVGTVTAEDILQLSREAVQEALAEHPNPSVLLLFSCVGRFITLGLDTVSEMKEAARDIPPDVPYLACYVSGELCPIQVEGKLQNCFHNNSFIVCALH